MISDDCKKALHGFIGYGVEHPRFVFIGPEEGSDNHLLNLEARGAFPPKVHDRDTACRSIAAAYQASGLGKAAKRYTEAIVPGTEKTWEFASKLIASLRVPVTTWEDEYTKLGSRSGDSLLAELFPLPKKGVGCWPSQYAAEFGFANEGHYYDQVWPRDTAPGSGSSPRAELIWSALSNIPLSSECMVFGYGRGGRRAEFWARFDRLFEVNGDWSVVIQGVAEVSRHPSGAIVGRLAHPSRNGITESAIPSIVSRIKALMA